MEVYKFVLKFDKVKKLVYNINVKFSENGVSASVAGAFDTVGSAILRTPEFSDITLRNTHTHTHLIVTWLSKQFLDFKKFARFNTAVLRALYGVQAILTFLIQNINCAILRALNLLSIPTQAMPLPLGGGVLLGRSDERSRCLSVVTKREGEWHE
jgi:hypothetical protein